MKTLSPLVLLLLLAIPAPGESQPPTPAEPLSASLKRSSVPVAMDMMRNVCKAAVKERGIPPIRVADLDPALRDDLERVFPARVLESANLYFDVPFHDGSAAVGLFSMLGMVAHGGGLVLAMAFENDVYLYCPQDDLSYGPALPRVLAHELCHVAQYQALSYEGYKERYADEMARGIPYEHLSIERDAYTLGALFPNLVPPGYFTFLSPAPETPKQLATLQKDGPGQDETKTQEVRITGTFESLERRAQLVLPNEPAEPTIRPQVLDPFGGAPLHVFEHVSGKSPRLLYNDPVTGNGPVLVAVGDDAGTEIAWRELDGFRSQWIPGTVRFTDINRDGLQDIEQQTDEGTATWWWTRGGFAKMTAYLPNDSTPSGDHTQ